jgi:hypothetical protein
MSQQEFEDFEAYNRWKESVPYMASPMPTTTTEHTQVPIIVHRGALVSPGNSTPTDETTPVSSGLADIIAVLPASVVKAAANVVAVCHKEVAFVLGTLAAFNITPTNNKTTDHIGAILLLGYTAIVHAANALGTKKAA